MPASRAVLGQAISSKTRTLTSIVVADDRAVKHVRTLNSEIRKASTLSEEELYTYAKVSESSTIDRSLSDH